MESIDNNHLDEWLEEEQSFEQFKKNQDYEVTDTIKRPFIHPNDRTDDEKLNMMFGSHKGNTAKIFTEAQDKKNRTTKHAESNIQSSLCKWLKLQHPNVYFISDFAAGMKLTPVMANIRASQAPKMKVLDLSILEPRKGYHGLIIELKSDIASPYLKDGVTLKSNEHLESQQWSINLLKTKGYAACFAVGFDQAKEYIEKYLSLPIF